MKKIIFLALIFLFAVAQSTLVNGLRIFGIKPDLLWIIAMAGALYFDFPAAVVFGAVCGFLKDCMGAQPLGIYVVALPLWCVVVRGISRRVSFDYISVSALFLAIMIFANAVIIRWTPFVAQGHIPIMVFMRVGIIESVYTALVFILLCPWLRSIAESRMW